MKKSEKREKALSVIGVGITIKSCYREEFDIDTVDFMVEAALEKLGVDTKKIKKMFQKG